MNTTVTVTKILVSAALFAACGKTEQKVQTSDTSKNGIAAPGANVGGTTADPLAGLADDNCKTKDACNAVTYSIVDETGVDVSTGSLQPKSASVGMPIQWSLTVKMTTPGAPQGRVMLAPSQVPLWMTINNGTDKGSKILTGTPDAAAASVQMIFIARDMIKCKVTEASQSVCLDGKTSLPAYDKTVAISYSVIGGTNVVNGVPGVNGQIVPTTNVNQAIQQQTCVNNANMTGSVLGSFFGPIAGMVGTIASTTGC